MGEEKCGQMRVENLRTSEKEGEGKRKGKEESCQGKKSRKQTNE